MAKRGTELTRESIMHEAENLFRHNGVHATSLMDIAKAAGISKGTLYYHYAAKETLVLEIAQRHFSALTEKVYAWIDTLNPDAGIKEALIPLAGELFPDIEIMRLHFALLSEAMRNDGELISFVTSKHKEWAVILELGALRLTTPGRFKDFGKTVITLINSHVLNSLLGEEMDIGCLLKMLGERLA